MWRPLVPVLLRFSGRGWGQVYCNKTKTREIVRRRGGLERWQFVRVVTVTLFLNMRLIFPTATSCQCQQSLDYRGKCETLICLLPAIDEMLVVRL